MSFYQLQDYFNYWWKSVKWKDGKFLCSEDAHEEDQYTANVQ